MTRRGSIFVTIVLFFAAAAMAAPAGTAYTVVLDNGSYVHAKARPTVENGMALIQLGNGTQARIDEGRIDWDRSDQMTARLTAPAPEPAPRSPLPPAQVKDIPDTMTLEGDGEEASEGRVPALTLPSPGYDGWLLEMQSRLHQLDDQLYYMEIQRYKIEREMYWKKWNLDIVWSLYDDLYGLEDRMRLVERERTLILRDLRQNG